MEDGSELRVLSLVFQSVYGQTETTAIVSMTEPEDSETLMTTTVGTVCEHVEVSKVAHSL